MITFIADFGTKTLTYIDGLTPVTINNHPRFLELYDALNKGEDERFRSLLKKGEDQEVLTAKVGAISKPEWLPEETLKEIENLTKMGYSIERFDKFLKNLSENRSFRARKELAKFLNKNGLPITEDGCFYGYKKVDNNGWSIHGNLETVVVHGEIDEEGRIKNVVGDYVEIEPSSVDDDFRTDCSNGLHVGSFDYASKFSKGQLLLVKVNPAHVITVPDNGNKLRCYRYDVIAMADEEMPSGFYVSHDDNDDDDDDYCYDCHDYCGGTCCHEDEDEDEDEDGEETPADKIDPWVREILEKHQVPDRVVNSQRIVSPDVKTVSPREAIIMLKTSLKQQGATTMAAEQFVNEVNKITKRDDSLFFLSAIDEFPSLEIRGTSLDKLVVVL